MIRLMQLFFGFFPLMFITTMKSEDVTLTQQCPDQASPGEEFIVEVNVEKGDIEGFAKFQFSLPDGVTAEQVDTKGATFTFDDQTVKIIWIALPSESTFTFTYKVKVSENAPKLLVLGGKFSYLEDNNRMIAELKDKTIQIGTEEQLAAANAEPEPIPAEATVTRSFSPQEDGSFLVTVSIAKQGIEGFSKVEELMPKDASVEEVDAQNGVFSYLRGKAKIVWMNTPEGDNLEVQYKIIPNEGFTSDQVSGEYAFLADNATQKVTISTSGEPIAAAEMKSETSKGTETEPVEEPKEVVAEEPTEEATQPIGEEKSVTAPETKEEMAMEDPIPEQESESVTEEAPIEETVSASNEAKSKTIPSPQEGVQYRVQILAGKKVVDGAYFKQYHEYEEGFIVENHQGWVKYTTGEFDVYKGARDKRENLTSSYNLPGPFVTAYNNGQRITVQEALMITNQKWFK